MPLAVYYIVGEAIYQAPNIAKLIGNRMVSSMFILNHSEADTRKAINRNELK